MKGLPTLSQKPRKDGAPRAGRLHPSKKPAKTKAKPNKTATYGNDVEDTGEQTAQT